LQQLSVPVQELAVLVMSQVDLAAAVGTEAQEIMMESWEALLGQKLPLVLYSSALLTQD
jgi:hypothetical protein